MGEEGKGEKYIYIKSVGRKNKDILVLCWERERGENVTKGQNRKDKSGVMWWRKGERDKKYFRIEVGSYHMGKREREREKCKRL